jgi:hypothetical protein
MTLAKVRRFRLQETIIVITNRWHNADLKCA